VDRRQQVIEVRCAATATTATFESEDRAIDVGWLKVSSREKGRVLWFAPGQGHLWADVVVREGLATREQLTEAAPQFVREGRIRE
jgi:hypothetical protein